MDSPPNDPGNSVFKQISQVLVASVVILVMVMFFTILVRHVRDRWYMQRSETVPSTGQLAMHTINVQGQHGLDEATIAMLGPVHEFSAEKEHDVEDGVKDCAVCLAEYREGDPCRHLDKCGHFFHKDCIDAWLRTSASCPLCRVSVLPASKLATSSATGSPSALIDPTAEQPAGSFPRPIHPLPHYNPGLFDLPGARYRAYHPHLDSRTAVTLPPGPPAPPSPPLVPGAHGPSSPVRTPTPPPS